MHDNLACAAEGPTLIEPNGKMRVPVRMFVNPQIMPGANAIDELLELARIAELQHPIAAMPDVHYKGRNPAPTGIVMAMIRRSSLGERERRYWRSRSTFLRTSSRSES